jgi:hypothetical protein
MRECPCLTDAGIAFRHIVILQSIELNGDHLGWRDVRAWRNHIARASSVAEKKKHHKDGGYFAV